MILKRRSQYAKRQKRNDPHQTYRWHKYAREYLKRPENRLCRECKRKGITELAECVDHIVPYPIHPDFWDASNHQPLSNSCHSKKTREDQKKYKDV